MKIVKGKVEDLSNDVIVYTHSLRNTGENCKGTLRSRCKCMP